jgi:hypothetical protein
MSWPNQRGHPDCKQAAKPTSLKKNSARALRTIASCMKITLKALTGFSGEQLLRRTTGTTSAQSPTTRNRLSVKRHLTHRAAGGHHTVLKNFQEMQFMG